MSMFFANKKRLLEQGSVSRAEQDACPHMAKAIATSNSAKNPGRQYIKCEDCRTFVGWCDEEGGAPSGPTAAKPGPWKKAPVAQPVARPAAPTIDTASEIIRIREAIERLVDLLTPELGEPAADLRKASDKLGNVGQ